MTSERPDGFVADLPNCGVTAIAIATGQNYRKIWNWFRDKRNHSNNWKGRTFRSDYAPALEFFETKFNNLPFCGMTVANFINWQTVKDRMYLVSVSGHTFIVHNGIVSDNTKHHGKSAIDAFGRRKIKLVYEIIR